MTTIIDKPLSINQSINHKSLCSIATARLEMLHNAVWQSRWEIRWWDLHTIGWTLC